MGVALIHGLQPPQNLNTLLCVGQQLREGFSSMLFPDFSSANIKYLKKNVNDNMNGAFLIIKS